MIAAAGLGARVGGFLLGKAWNIGAIIALAASIYLGIQLMQANGTIKDRNATITRLESRNTQLERDLAQARTNVTTVQTALNQANASLRNLSERSQAKLGEAQRAVNAAKAKSAEADRRAQNMLQFKPQGADQCARMLDVDRKFLESLK